MRLSRSSPVERLRPPKHLQDKVTKAGGLNRYGEPNFKLAWAQTETTRQGGEWDNEDGFYRGYRDVYLSDGLPHWVLLQWADAGKSIAIPHLPPETDAGFYRNNACPKTGLCLLGEYPYRGSYQVAHSFMAKYFENGEMKIEAFPLTGEVVDLIIPIIKGTMRVSVQAKLQFMKDEAEKHDEEYAKKIEDAYKSAKLPNHVKTSQWIEDKVRSMEKAFNSSLITMMHRNKRMQTERPIWQRT